MTYGPNTPGKLILASASPRRQELIRIIGWPVEICPANVDERMEAGMPPSRVVEELSRRKADTVYRRKQQEGCANGIVVGSDTLVSKGERILGKPVDRHDAVRMLQDLQGSRHEVYTAVTCMDLETGVVKSGFRETRVDMKPLNSDQIDRYVESGEPMDKAGAYAIQGLGSVFVDRIEGDYFSVVGLSLSLLSDLLREFGAELP